MKTLNGPGYPTTLFVEMIGDQTTGDHRTIADHYGFARDAVGVMLDLAHDAGLIDWTRPDGDDPGRIVRNP